MTQPLERRLPLSALVMLVAALLLSASEARADTAEALRFVPPSATSLLVVDADATLKSPFIKALRKELLDLAGATRDVQRLKREAGVDVFKDLRAIVFAGTDRALRKANASVLILSGELDALKLATFYAKRGKAEPDKRTHEGHEVFVIGKESWLAVKGGVAIVGHQDLVKEALAAYKSGSKGPSGPLAKALPQKRQGIWGAIVGGDALDGVLGKELNRFKGITSASFDLSLANGIALSLGASFPKAADAEAARASIATEVKALGEDREFKALGADVLTRNLTVSARGNALSVALNLSGEGVGQLTSALKELFE